MDEAQPTNKSSWTNILKTQPPPSASPNPQTATSSATVNRVLETAKSREGISVAIIDANAVIQGGENLHGLSDKFVTVPEVLSEIRDPVSRHRLNFVSFDIDAMEPSPEALNKVIKFARETGDLQTLSDVDLKLIALTYIFEEQLHGTKHLRDAPPPIHTVNVKRLPEKDMPGWGSNVSNLEEWEALEHAVEDKSNDNSRILPLKDISLNVPVEQKSEDGSVGSIATVKSENGEEVEDGTRKGRRYPPKKREINIEGKKMVASGIDASNRESNDNAGDWMPAVSQSTHRRYLRRKARREHYAALSEKESQQDVEMDTDNIDGEEATQSVDISHQTSEFAAPEDNVLEEKEDAKTKLINTEEDISTILKQMRLEEDSLNHMNEENDFPDMIDGSDSEVMEASSDKDKNNVLEEDEVDTPNADMDHLEISSQTNESINTSCMDEDGSKQSWMLRSLSESSVACITSDFAMQNVLLQMGLRLIAPGGMQIRQLQRWILRCHACYTVTTDIGRIFCPKCGNGGTLRKVAITVGENGITLAARRPRITLRGTKFSLPLPKGGRDAIAKNVILCEDQLPQKYLYPKTKKKANKQGNDFFIPDDIFSHSSDKRTPFQPPVRKALAVFSQRRNPNDNHFSRPKH